MTLWRKSLFLACSLSIVTHAQSPPAKSMVRTWIDGSVRKSPSEYKGRAMACGRVGGQPRWRHAAGHYSIACGRPYAGHCPRLGERRLQLVL